MQSKKKELKQQKKLHLLPQNVGHGIMLFLSMLASMVFLATLLVVDSFPAIYILAILVLMVIAMVAITALLNSRKVKTKRRKIGVILSVIFIIVMGVGSYYLFSTYSMFNQISENDTQTEDFHVIVLAESSYNSLADIKGKEVVVTKAESATYKEAKGTLLGEADVVYQSVEDYLDAGHQLIDKKGEKTDNIIFINNPRYEMLCEDIEGFKENTKIIHTISIEKTLNDISKRVDITKEPYNIYISGIDTYGSINTTARTDVNMIMTVNPKTKQILLTSIPRDMYVTLHSYGAKDKLTHSGLYGIEETVSTVEDWLSIDLNYYIRVNFTTLVEIVDVLGGVSVDSEYAFHSFVSPYSYSAGTNELSGEAALYFARERKSLAGGDNERVKNQQRVMKAIINKITTSSVILTRYTQLLDAVGGNIQTNLDDSDISAFVKMQLEDLGGWDITNNSIEGQGSSATTYSMGSQKLSIQIPVDESVAEAQKQINKIIYADQIEQIQHAE